MKVHIGRSHKDPEVLREEHEVSMVLSEPGDVARSDDPSVNADNSFLGVVNQDPPEPAHPHSVWVFCPKAECKVKKMRVEIEIMHKRPCKNVGQGSKMIASAVFVKTATLATAATNVFVVTADMTH